MEGRCEKDTGSNIKKQQSEIDLPTLKNISDEELCSVFSMCKIKRSLFSDIMKINAPGYDKVVQDIKEYRNEDYNRICVTEYKTAEYIHYCIIKEIVCRFIKGKGYSFMGMERDLFCLQ